MRRVLSTALLGLLFATSGPAAAKDPSKPEDYVNAKVLSVQPFERAVGAPARLTVRGRMQKGYQFAEAVLVRPDGSAISVKDVKLDGPRFVVKLKLARGRGIYRFSITGTTGRDRTHHGLRVWLYAGVPAGHPDEPPPADVKPDPRIPGDVLAVDLFRRVNAHRRKIGEKALAWHEPFAKAARLHAAECVKRKKLDHKFQGVGTVAWRAEEMFGFEHLVYRRPPDKPARGPAPSYVATLLDARRGLEPILYRWKRLGALCLPMTSDRMTHAACGVARTKGGSVYVVFLCLQLNGKHIERVTDAEHAAAVREVASRLTLDEERPARLRELGLWLSKKGKQLAKKHAGSDDPALCAAALDVLLLHDPEEARRDIDKGIRLAESEYGRVEVGASPSNRHLSLLRGAAALTYAPDLRDRATKVESLRRAAAAKALAHVLAQEQDDAERRRALTTFLSRWPGTPAAEEARKRL